MNKLETQNNRLEIQNNQLLHELQLQSIQHAEEILSVKNDLSI